MLALRRAGGRNLRCGYGREAVPKGPAHAGVTSVDHLCQRLTADSECQPSSLRVLRGSIPPRTRGATECRERCRLRGEGVTDVQSLIRNVSRFDIQQPPE